MTIDNFNWFLHVMLFYYTENVLDKIKEKERKKKRGAHTVRNKTVPMIFCTSKNV